MKITLITLSILIVGSIISLFVLGLMSKSGNAPGLSEGNLSPCASKPNCVCSEQNADDSQHYITPIIISKRTTNALLPLIKEIIMEMGGQIQTQNDHYLAATFVSAIFGFVDDFEIRLDQKKEALHLRSASRVGYNDRGVNKKRTALFKKRLSEKLSDNN